MFNFNFYHLVLNLMEYFVLWLMQWPICCSPHSFLAVFAFLQGGELATFGRSIIWGNKKGELPWIIIWEVATSPPSTAQMLGLSVVHFGAQHP